MTRTRRTFRTRALGPALGLALALSACGGAGGPTAGEGSGRPSDGLVSDSELRAVVELQVHRDGAGLTALLSASRAPVRARAAFALASVQDTAAVDELAAALRDADANVRRDAAFALGQAGMAASVPALAAALGTERDPGARRALLAALGKLPSREASAALLAVEPRAGEEAARVAALARLGAVRLIATPQAQELLLARLDDSDPAVRRAAAYYFGRLPDATPWAPRVARVREALDGYGRNDLAAMYLLQALGRLADPADTMRLRDPAVTARDWRIRVNAVNALGAFSTNSGCREALLDALDDASIQVAVAAGETLTRGAAVPSELQRMRGWIEANPTKWQAAAPLLVVLARADEREFVFRWFDRLREDDVYRRAVGLRALAFLPGQDVLDRLAGAAASRNPRTQSGAVGALVQRWSQDRAFAGTQERYFRVFSGVLRSGSPSAAFSAAEALADPLFVPYGSADVLVEAWRGMSAPEDLEPMMAVVEALGRIGGPEAVGALSEAAARPQRALREAALKALKGLGIISFPSLSAPASPEPAVAAQQADSASRVDWAYLAALGRAPRLRLETERGTVVLALAPEEAPVTVQTIVRLAEGGRYDGVPFHRVVPNFVVQGGDFASGDGFGGPGFTIPSEFTEIPFVEGVVGMASAGKDTEGSQFFITHSPQPHLDGLYTAFGRVVSGMEVVTELAVGDRIVRATVERGR